MLAEISRAAASDFSHEFDEKAQIYLESRCLGGRVMIREAIWGFEELRSVFTWSAITPIFGRKVVHRVY
jgi:hypothetical protein